MIIFFDVDDTLYDRGLPFIAAAKELLGDTVPDLREAYRCCSIRSNEVFLPSQRGEITMDEMYIYRWGKGFADVGIRISDEEALEFQRLYRLQQDHITISPEIKALLQKCRERADGLGVITNGPSDKQWNKVQRLGLEQFMDRRNIIISGDVGIDKPDPAIFRLAEQRAGASPKDLLYIGDSLANDIIPAAACGWHTLWYNSTRVPVPADLPAGTVIAETPAEIEDLLG